jgi:hypothetical protein
MSQAAGLMGNALHMPAPSAKPGATTIVSIELLGINEIVIHSNRVER